MTFFAIDPSLNQTGFCYQNGETGIMKPKDASDRGPIRLTDLLTQLRRLLASVEPTCVVLEDYAYSAQGAALMQLAEWGGVLRLTLHTHKIPVAMVSPSALKKYVTGKGNASKDLMVSTMSAKMGRVFPDNDQADAFALMSMALHHYLDRPFFAVPKLNQEALLTVKWPEWPVLSA